MMSKEQNLQTINLKHLQDLLSHSDNKESFVWRSLQSLAQQILAKEEKSENENLKEENESSEHLGLNRRHLLQWLAAVAGLISSGACTRQPKEYIVPYAKMPEHIIPGKSIFYATSFPLNGFGLGVLVESHMGRPTKVEGNSLHPASFGSTDAFAQASLLTLYDPDRAQAVTYMGQISSWERFTLDLQTAMQKAQTSGKNGSIRILTPTVTSPTLGDQLNSLTKQNPLIKWHQCSPMGCDNQNQGSLYAFERSVSVKYDLSMADVVVSLDADIFMNTAGRIAYAKQFSKKRLPNSGPANPNRLYSLYSTPSLTSAVSDHRLGIPPSQIEICVYALAKAVGCNLKHSVSLTSDQSQWIDNLAKDLKNHPSRGVVIVDEMQPPSVHVLAHAINDQLGNFNKTVFLIDPLEIAPTIQNQSITELVMDMKDGKVDILLILSTNPVYSLPSILDFSSAMAKVAFKAQLSLYHDETTPLCNWHIPECHYMESWGDIRSYDGTISLIQPIIEPIFASKSSLEFVAAILGQPNQRGYEIVQNYWKTSRPSSTFENDFNVWLQTGSIPNTTSSPLNLKPKLDYLNSNLFDRNQTSQQLEVCFRPDPCVWDGEFSNNAWLQELPKPLSKLTWDNAALVSPITAEQLNLSNGDIIELSYQGLRLKAPVWILPGHALSTLTLNMGYGRSGGGRLAQNIGFNVNQLRMATNQWFQKNIKIQKTNQKYTLACTQEHHSLHGRNIIQFSSLDAYRSNPDLFKEKDFREATFQPTIPLNPQAFPPDHEEEYQWGMAINLNTCIGCNACVVACQAENNIPVVGKEGVILGREMHWLRIDTYYSGKLDNPDTYFQPLPCMHCESAPCELVCPVNATVHSKQGLNQMVYNRCVGTRYCSNNCPYKVRRFNYFDYNDPRPLLKMVRNPDVTVRSRGVMEKCTYCIQRISQARIEARVEGRTLQAEEVQTACQQVCPTNAIVFGNINDSNWQVTKLKQTALNYELLGDLNTKPRTTYLAKIKNHNSKMPDSNFNEE